MTAAVNPEVRRPYVQVRRADQARRTRASIVAAARELFLADGYVATTLAAVATRAGVSPKTINLTFGTKAQLFHAVVQIAVAGDDEAVAIANRDSWTDMLAQPPATMLATFAAGTLRIHERTATLFAVADVAATVDLELATLRARGLAARANDYEHVARVLHRHKALRPPLSINEATDHLLVISSDATYRTLVQDRGWTGRRYTSWLADTLQRTLLTDAASAA